MHSTSFYTWMALGGTTVSRLTAIESAALIMLAAGLLVFRTFRERYLLIWIVGWLAFFVYRWTMHATGGDSVVPYLSAVAHAEFVLALFLFSAAVFVYSHSQKLLLPLSLVSLSVIAYALVQGLGWPDSFTLRVTLEVSYHLVAVCAATRW